MQKNLLSTLRPLLRNTSKLLTVPLVKHTINPHLMATSACASGSRGKLPKKMAKLQKQFQQNDGKPVFLKGGAMDNILYRLTWVLCLIGIVGDALLWFGYILA